MKKREVQELKNKPAEELIKLLKEKEENLRKIKFDLVQGKLKNFKSIGNLKKNIARIKTFINFKNEHTN